MFLRLLMQEKESIVERKGQLVHHSDDNQQMLEGDDSNSVEASDMFLDDVALFVRLRDIDQRCTHALGMLTRINSWFKKPESADWEALLERYQEDENQIFSEIPDYIQKKIDKKKENASQTSRSVQSQIKCSISSDVKLHDFSNYPRPFFSTDDPLCLPFDMKRNSNRNVVGQGKYHDLFFGDGSKCVFLPPPDKRALIEDRKTIKKAQITEQTQPEPVKKKTMIVDSNFVPSCAQVDHTAIQQKARAKKEQMRKKNKL